MDLISIVIPVYNVKDYLEKCFESVINQTYKNIEVILVNDGSTDGSGELCDDLALKDPRVVVYHKENGGLSSARNLGIDKAKGNYIGFIDSDDYIDLDMYDLLYRNIKNDNADIAMCGLYNIHATAQQSQEKNIQHFVVEPERAIQIVLDAKLTSVTAVNKLYKKELFNDLKYEVGRTSEDAFIIVKLLDKCNRISITNERKYYYFHRTGSITKQSFSIKTLDVIDAYKQNLNIIKKKYPRIIDSAKRRLCWSYFYVLDSLVISDRFLSERKLVADLTQELKKYNKLILTSPNFRINRKLMFLALYFNVYIYRWAVTLFKHRNN
ncbi:hyaluronan synthase [[Pasteurella] aerogenes]|nr:hyaluronan synthase [[Pasteurella] aerogenes]